MKVQINRIGLQELVADMIKRIVETAFQRGKTKFNRVRGYMTASAFTSAMINDTMMSKLTSSIGVHLGIDGR